MNFHKIIILLEGGLGNQMFQYAFGSIIAKKNNTKLTIDTTFFERNNNETNCINREFGLDIFDIDISKVNYLKTSLLTRLINKIYKKKHIYYKEPSFAFNPNALKLKKPITISGYFQSYKYFIGYEDFIKSIFKFPEEKIGKKNIETLKEIIESNSISIHIRRGDYVNNLKTSQTHGICSLDYYHKAIIELTKDKKDDFKLYFFSDDITWVKDNFNKINLNKNYITNNTQENSWIDMFLMSKCKHNIIANSSFSFWGAWLNSNNNKKIIAPKAWFLDEKLEKQSKNLIPQEWIRI